MYSLNIYLIHSRLIKNIKTDLISSRFSVKKGGVFFWGHMSFEGLWFTTVPYMARVPLTKSRKKVPANTTTGTGTVSLILYSSGTLNCKLVFPRKYSWRGRSWQLTVTHNTTRTPPPTSEPNIDKNDDYTQQTLNKSFAPNLQSWSVVNHRNKMLVRSPERKQKKKRCAPLLQPAFTKTWRKQVQPLQEKIHPRVTTTTTTTTLTKSRTNAAWKSRNIPRGVIVQLWLLRLRNLGKTAVMIVTNPKRRRKRRNPKRSPERRNRVEDIATRKASRPSVFLHLLIIIKNKPPSYQRVHERHPKRPTRDHLIPCPATARRRHRVHHPRSTQPWRHPWWCKQQQ